MPPERSSTNSTAPPGGAPRSSTNSTPPPEDGGASSTISTPPPEQAARGLPQIPRQAPKGTGRLPQIPRLPPRDFGLILWFLTHRVPVNRKRISAAHVEQARAHCGMSAARLAECRLHWPRAWSRMLARRRRRLAFWLKHGWIWPGWTPPDPEDPRTRTEPIALRRYWSPGGGAAKRAQRSRGASEWATNRALRRLNRLRNTPPPAKDIRPRMRALDKVLAEFLAAAGML